MINVKITLIITETEGKTLDCGTICVETKLTKQTIVDVGMYPSLMS